MLLDASQRMEPFEGGMIDRAGDQSKEYVHTYLNGPLWSRDSLLFARDGDKILDSSSAHLSYG